MDDGSAQGVLRKAYTAVHGSARRLIRRSVITVRPNDPTRYEPRLVLSEPAQLLPMPPYCDANDMKVIADLRLVLEMIANFNSPDPDATAVEERDMLIAIARNALGCKSKR